MADQLGSCASQRQPFLSATRLLRTVRVAVVVVAVVLAASCSGDATGQAERRVSPTPIAAPTGLSPDGAELTLEVVDGGTATGLVITDHRGMAVYGVAGETVEGPLICVGECLDVWVPVAPREGAVTTALDESLYAVFTRPDGIVQATYADVPLYLWTGDSEIGITGGAGVAGTWYALTATSGFVQ